MSRSIFFVSFFFCVESILTSCLKTPLVPYKEVFQNLPDQISINSEELSYMKNICLHKFSKTFSPAEVTEIKKKFLYIRLLMNMEEFSQEIEKKFSNFSEIPEDFDIPVPFKKIKAHIFSFLEHLKSNHPTPLLICREGIWDIKTYNQENIVWIGKTVDILQEKNAPTLFLQLLLGTLHQIKSSPAENYLIENLGVILTILYISHMKALSTLKLTPTHKKCANPCT